MLTIENTETFGWEAAIRGMRNPMNSWQKSDSRFCNAYDVNEWCVSSDKCDFCGKCLEDKTSQYSYTHIGKNDLDLMKRLRNAGTDHRKYLRMITVYCDIIAPLYWWKEFDTYKISTVANSCSTMHKIQAKEFALNDFSCEHLTKRALLKLNDDVSELNFWREAYNAKTDMERSIYMCNNNWNDTYVPSKKECWWQMIQLLPSSYNQKRTIMMNYEVLTNIYKSRKNHKLDEWHTLCDWVKELPYSELIIMEDE